MQVDQMRRRPYPKWLMKFALGKALARPSPDHIPLGPASRLVGRNYATTYIDGATPERYWLADGIQGSTVELRNLENSHEPERGTADLKDLNRANFRIRVYREQLEWQFFSLYRYALFVVFGTPRLRVAVDSIRQKATNRASLPTIERTKALQIAIERTTERANATISVHSILPLHARQHRHPNLESAFRFHTFVLDSLVESGELRRVEYGRYEVLPKALVTLDRYLMEERRIKAQGRAALWTALLAAVVSGLVSGIASLK